MALVSPVPPAILQQELDFLRFVDVRVSTNTMMPSSNNSRSSIGVDESVTSVIEEKLYVCLGKDVKEGKSILLWALQNSGGKRICVVHIHQPAQMIPLMGGKFPASKLKKQEVRAHRELERQNMHKILNEYLLICNQVGARAEKLHIEVDCIEKGIVQVISQYGIRKLIMGTAAKKHHSRKMIDLKSKKAIYVNVEAPVTCHIRFVCKGHLIFTREGVLDVINEEVSPKMEEPSPKPETGQSSPLIARSMTLGQNIQQSLFSPGQDHRRAMSVNFDVHQRRGAEIYSPDGARGVSSSQSGWDSERSSDCLSTCSSSDVLSSVALIPFVRSEGSEDGTALPALPEPKEDVHQTSPPSVMEGRVDDELYDQLEQAMAEARNSKREAFEESVRRGKAEKDAIEAIRREARAEDELYEQLGQAMVEARNSKREAFEESVRRGKAEQDCMEAIRRAKAAESLYTEELKKRQDVEAALERERQEVENMQNQRDEAIQELCSALDQKTILENQLAESDEMVKELEVKNISAVELLESYKKERDNALKVADEVMAKKQDQASSSNSSHFLPEFSFSEIEEATRSFDRSLKICEGGYGSIYRGSLCHTEVAIKMLHSQSLQGPSEYQQEVDILSKLRHPNLVTLIGACPEGWTLIYEYLPNGSLEDRLSCKDNSSPLSWKTRIRIAAELCSVLVFLHSSKPRGVVHGHFKPSNILLDANFVSKLGDFGIFPSENASSSDTTDTCAYTDPEFLATGELTAQSDVYSFGVVLLRLLTGLPALGITNEVQNAIDSGDLKSVLDELAGEWPYVQAQQLAHLALRCTEVNGRDRPDLASEAWRVLEPMRASCRGASSSSRQGSEELQAPHYFTCPIFQEVMEDPHVAADGFTYEAEALRGWLESGHDTSPMTNLTLANTNLVPNLALRSAIQEWMQHY